MAALWVFLGGGVGALMRWGLALAMPAPWGTLVANVVGSFGLALFIASPIGRHQVYKPLLGFGLFGGFTTYSTYNHEVMDALTRGSYGVAAAHVVGTTALCLGAGAIGYGLGTMISQQASG